MKTLDEIGLVWLMVATLLAWVITAKVYVQGKTSQYAFTATTVASVAYILFYVHLLVER